LRAAEAYASLRAMKLKLLLAVLLTALLGTAALAMAPSHTSFYVMRHLNTPEGVKDPDLLPEGTAKAQALVTWFQDKPLTAIYVSDFKRTRQTAAPLAAARGITVKVYDPSDTPGLVARLNEEIGAVLVVGHSNTVPDIVDKLGGERPGPLSHPDFGDIWTVAHGRTIHAKL
jgi:phosphohistidine phosphatase SixA